MTNPLSDQTETTSDAAASTKSEQLVSRLAPSPTGALHLGNLRTFMVNWALARQRCWQLKMRMEDLDGPRIKPESAEQTLDVLKWIGIDWDEDVLVQSKDLSPYRLALEQLGSAGAVYACELSRREMEAAMSAPHSTDSRSSHSVSTRPPHAGDPTQVDQPGANFRLMVDEPDEAVDDELTGRTVVRLKREFGDCVIWTKQGTPAYQLAVVVDDLRQGVTDVVRGDDLLASAALQQRIYRLLGEAPPTWWHLPLVLGKDGRRLAKRHGDTRIATYRNSGLSSDRIVGLIAQWCGLIEHPIEMTMNDFLQCFRLDALPMDPVIFDAKDEAWLAGE